MAGLGGNGLLLVTGEAGNPMTIGWGTLGIIWAKPVFTVLIRPSRHSFSLIESLPEFTVCVPTVDMRRTLSICGSKSGRDTDKIARCGLTLNASNSIAVPWIGECPVHYECRVLHRTEVKGEHLTPGVTTKFYTGEDLHRIYHGEILGVYRE